MCKKFLIISLVVLFSTSPGFSQNTFPPYYKVADIKEQLMKHKHRGGLASVMRAGLVNSNGVTTVSIVNSVYISYAYLEEHTDNMPVGLLDPDKGESAFLPIIGEENISAMPYEIILQGKEATMLHGRFRIALHWPELSMKTFTKITSTPMILKNYEIFV